MLDKSAGRVGAKRRIEAERLVEVLLLAENAWFRYASALRFEATQTALALQPVKDLRHDILDGIIDSGVARIIPHGLCRR